MTRRESKPDPRSWGIKLDFTFVRIIFLLIFTAKLCITVSGGTISNEDSLFPTIFTTTTEELFSNLLPP